jgi:hypothetical protein
VSPSVLGSCLESFKEPITGFRVLLRQKPPLSVDTVRVEVNLNGLPDNVVHISGFCGKDGITVGLNTVAVQAPCPPEMFLNSCTYTDRTVTVEEQHLETI